MGKAGDPQDEGMLKSWSTKKRGTRTASETTDLKRKKTTAHNPPTKSSESASPQAQTMEQTPSRGTPSPSSSNLQTPMGSPFESLTFWENHAFCKPQDDQAMLNGLMFDKLFAEGTQCQMKALRYSNIQQVLVKRLMFELEGARSELSQLCSQQDNPTTAQKQLEERLAERERRLKEEEEAHQKVEEELLNTLELLKEERNHAQKAVADSERRLKGEQEARHKEKGELLNTLESLKEERSHAQEAMAEGERRLKEEEEARCNENDQFQKEKGKLLNTLVSLEEERNHAQEALGETERRLKEEEEARRNEKDQFQKEKEELLNALNLLKEERNHAQEVVAESERRLKEEKDALRNDKDKFEKEKEELLDALLSDVLNSLKKDRNHAQEAVAESERRLREEEEARCKEKYQFLKEKEELLNALESLKAERNHDREAVTDTGRRVKEEEEARRNEKDRFQKEKEELLNALDSLKEEKNRAQEAVAERERRLKEEEEARCIEKHRFQKEKEELFNALELLKEEKNHAQDAVVETERRLKKNHARETLVETQRRLKEEEEARCNEKHRFQKEKEELLNALKLLKEERNHAQEAVAEAKAKAVAEYKAGEAYEADLRACYLATVDFVFMRVWKSLEAAFPNSKDELGVCPVEAYKAVMKKCQASTAKQQRRASSSLKPPASG
ncbi:hypothetical protein CRG98_020812 [Punica granatum]|uniref:Trichohyalin-like n=1 Tax=Punica granatum TaxID=22663 RepID=A0A2I0JRB4_PUNGR|nr:hypothetical protein CRG98_020812 [Punica granatum]